MFSCFIYFIDKYYACTFNAICKENAAKNCIDVKRKKLSLPATLTGRNFQVYETVIHLTSFLVSQPINLCLRTEVIRCRFQMLPEISEDLG
jgi:hypothetical protein